MAVAEVVPLVQLAAAVTAEAELVQTLVQVQTLVLQTTAVEPVVEDQMVEQLLTVDQD